MSANKEYSRLYYELHKEKIIARSLAYQKANKERTNAKNKAWRERNPEKAKEAIVKYCANNNEKKNARNRNWKKDNPSTVNDMTAYRRAKKLNATPAWANSFFISEAYRLAKLRTKATGFKWEVDHFYPLQSDLVCGLHVEHNLQVIPATLNRSKGNKVLHHG